MRLNGTHTVVALASDLNRDHPGSHANAVYNNGRAANGSPASHNRTPSRNDDRSLHHFVDQQLAVIELIRVLQSGGRLVIEEPDVRLFPVKLLALDEKVALMRSKFYTPQAIAGMAAAQGAQVTVESDGRFAIWVIGDKL